MSPIKNPSPIRNEPARAGPCSATRCSSAPLVHEAAQRLKELDHALRTPVGAMVVAVELLHAAPDEPTRAEARQVIGRQLQRVRELLDGLRDLTRELETGASASGVRG